MVNSRYCPKWKPRTRLSQTLINFSPIPLIYDSALVGYPTMAEGLPDKHRLRIPRALGSLPEDIWSIHTVSGNSPWLSQRYCTVSRWIWLRGYCRWHTSSFYPGRMYRSSVIVTLVTKKFTSFWASASSFRSLVFSSMISAVLIVS